MRKPLNLCVVHGRFELIDFRRSASSRTPFVLGAFFAWTNRRKTGSISVRRRVVSKDPRIFLREDDKSIGLASPIRLAACEVVFSIGRMRTVYGIVPTTEQRLGDDVEQTP